MSIYSTNHPPTISRSKALLTDIEQAKKNEWNRRRKLRLQQVREQSKDLAYNLLNKVRTEKQNFEKEEQNKLAKKSKLIKECEINKLQEEFQLCMSVVGTGHKSAEEQEATEKLLKEKQDMLLVISRARGALAAEKLKAEKKAVREKEEASSRCRELAKSLHNSRITVSNTPAPTALPKKSNLKKSVTSRDKKPTSKKTSPQKAKKRDHVVMCNLKSPEKESEQIYPLRDSTNTNDVGSPSKKSSKSQYGDEMPCGSKESSPVKLSAASDERRNRANRENLPKRPTTTPRDSKKNENVLPVSPKKCNEALKLKLNKVQVKPYSEHTSPVKVSLPSNIKKRQGGEEECSSPRRRRRLSNNSESYCGQSDDSDDSSVTWPLRTPSKRSVCSVGSPYVQLYDHFGRTCREYIRPDGTVAQIVPMSREDSLGEEFLIEEGGRVLQEELDEREKRRVDRGNKAMHKIKLRSEFDKMIRELSKLDKAERLKRIGCQKHIHSDLKAGNRSRRFRSKSTFDEEPGNWRITESQSNETLKSHVDGKPSIVTEDVACVGSFPLQSKYHPSAKSLIEKSENTLKMLLDKIHKERQLLLNENELPKFGSDTESEDEFHIPTWFSEQEVIKNSSTTSDKIESSNTSSTPEEPPQKILVEAMVHKNPDRTPLQLDLSTDETSSKLSEKQSSRKPKKFPSSTPKKKAKEKNGDTLDGERRSDENEVQSPIRKNDQFSLGENLLNKTDISDVIESPKDTSSSKESSSSFEGIKVIVKVCEKKDKYKGKEIKESCEENIPTTLEKKSSWSRKLFTEKENSTSSSTSYLSPPENLKPTQLHLLSTVLHKMKEKNDNPKLKEYITKLLKMSRESIDNMSVSVSDVSIQSDLINTTVTQNDGFDPFQQSENSPKSSTHSHNKEHEPYNEHRYKDVEVQCAQKKEDLGSQNGENGEILHYSNLAERYSQRINTLAKMIDSCRLSERKIPGRNGYLNDSSYLSVPSEINESVRISNSIRNELESGLLHRPDFTFNGYNGHQMNHLATFLPENSETKQCNLNSNTFKPKLKKEDIAALGLRMDILPKPCDLENGSNQRSHPPPSLHRTQQRVHIPLLPVPHELSTIAEVDSPSSSRVLKASGETVIRQISSMEDQEENDIVRSSISKNSFFYRNQPRKTHSDEKFEGMDDPTHCKSELQHFSHKDFETQKKIRSECILPRLTKKDKSPSKLKSRDKSGDQLNHSEITNRDCMSTHEAVNDEESFMSIDSDINSQISSVRPFSPNELEKEKARFYRLLSQEKINSDDTSSLNDSSLSLLSDMSDFSLLSERGLNGIIESSSDDFEDIFRNLGIGWALATLKKTKEAKRLSSDSSPMNSQNEKKEKLSSRSGEKSTSQSSKYRHSTPVKKYEGKSVCQRSRESNSPAQASFGGSMLSSLTPLVSSDSMSLTPPSLTLCTPLLELPSTSTKSNVQKH